MSQGIQRDRNSFAHPLSQRTRSCGNIAVAVFGLVPLELVESGVPPLDIFFPRRSRLYLDPRCPAEADAIQAFGTFRYEPGPSKLLPLLKHLPLSRYL